MVSNPFFQPETLAKALALAREQAKADDEYHVKMRDILEFVNPERKGALSHAERTRFLGSSPATFSRTAHVYAEGGRVHKTHYQNAHFCLPRARQAEREKA